MMTVHSQERMKERMGYRGEAARSIVEKALQRGHTAETARSVQVSLYLHSLESNDSYPIEYQNYCFIFSRSDNVCITVFPFPEWVHRKPAACGKRIIRNPRKYYRLYKSTEEKESY